MLAEVQFRKIIQIGMASYCLTDDFKLLAIHIDELGKDNSKNLTNSKFKLSQDPQ